MSSKPSRNLKKGTSSFKIQCTQLVLTALKAHSTIHSKSLQAILDGAGIEVHIRTCQRILTEMCDAGLIRPSVWDDKNNTLLIYCPTVETKHLLGLEVQS